MSTDALARHVQGLPLVDHHVHGALSTAVERAQFEELITESDRPIPGWMTQLDSQIGFAIRRHCAPAIGLPAGAGAADYFARRAELGEDAVNRALLGGAGVAHFLLDTGYRSDAILGLDQMAEVSGAETHEIVRIEQLLEQVATTVGSAAEFVDEFRSSLERATAGAVGLKSIIAYRQGFRFDPQPPGPARVAQAAGEWLRAVEGGAPARVTSSVLLRFGLWEGVATRLPLQLHVGYGDPDLDLGRCNPILLTEWIKQVEHVAPAVMLLHCYPYHREAGYLAQVFPHVYFDVGLATDYVGARAEAVLAESLELAPFAKTLYSSDAWGPAELHHLGAALWRHGITRLLGRWVDDGDWCLDDAVRVATMIGHDNAARVYQLDGR